MVIICDVSKISHLLWVSFVFSLLLQSLSYFRPIFFCRAKGNSCCNFQSFVWVFDVAQQFLGRIQKGLVFLNKGIFVFFFFFNSRKKCRFPFFSLLARRNFLQEYFMRNIVCFFFSAKTRTVDKQKKILVHIQPEKGMMGVILSGNYWLYHVSGKYFFCNKCNSSFFFSFFWTISTMIKV